MNECNEGIWFSSKYTAVYNKVCQVDYVHLEADLGYI